MTSPLKVKLSFVQRMELSDTGFTKVYIPPRVMPDDEVTFGRWIRVFRKGRSIYPVCCDNEPQVA